MRAAVLAGLFAAAQLALADAAGAQRKPRCPDGQLPSAGCIDAKRAAGQRENAVAHTQPRVSQTAPPRLPARDRGTYVRQSQPEFKLLLPTLRSSRSGTKP
jgi:hypothetical protein